MREREEIRERIENEKEKEREREGWVSNVRLLGVFWEGGIFIVDLTDT